MIPGHKTYVEQELKRPHVKVRGAGAPRATCKVTWCWNFPMTLWHLVPLKKCPCSSLIIDGIVMLHSLSMHSSETSECLIRCNCVERQSIWSRHNFTEVEPLTANGLGQLHFSVRWISQHGSSWLDFHCLDVGAKLFGCLELSYLTDSLNSSETIEC